MDPIFVILFVAIGGVMIGAGVHFIPVGGAPAAMATATGVGTGTAMLAAGAGLTGLITAATMTGEPWFIVGIGGAIGAMIMMGITMLIANFIYVYGVGIVPAASKVPVDIITKRNQEKYKTPGTDQDNNFLFDPHLRHPEYIICSLQCCPTSLCNYTLLEFLLWYMH